jgi:hypothetical protein
MKRSIFIIVSMFLAVIATLLFTGCTSSEQLTFPAELIDFTFENRTPFTLDSRNGEKLSPDLPVYHIVLSIDKSLAMYSGHLNLLYPPPSGEAPGKVLFRLYPNLLGGTLDVSAISINGMPAEGNFTGGGSCTLEIPFPAGTETGSPLEIKLDFQGTVPRGLGAGYGVLVLENDILALAHFYPILVPYREQQWENTPLVPYSDPVVGPPAYYFVEVEVPRTVSVVTSGVLTGGKETGKGKILQFAGGPARDFFLAASERWASYSIETQEVTVRSFYLPEDEASGVLAAQKVLDAINIYSDLYHEYPYREFDIVAVPTNALGIEYPGITGINYRIYNPAGNISGIPNRALFESTLAHEVAHQWFYNLVGSNQAAEPWIDEGFAQYSTWQYYIHAYGKGSADGFYQSLVSRWNRVDGAPIPIGKPVAGYQGKEYGAIIYGRAPLFIEALAELAGEELFEDFVRELVEDYSWETLTTELFKKAAEKSFNMDLTPIFDEWVY